MYERGIYVMYLYLLVEDEPNGRLICETAIPRCMMATGDTIVSTWFSPADINVCARRRERE